MKLFVFGLGYSASVYVRSVKPKLKAITGTMRSHEKVVAAEIGEDIDVILFDGRSPSQQVRNALRGTTHLLISIPPGPAGDPVLLDHASDIAATETLESIVYLSTVGVYGDFGGAWVDEATRPAPVSTRSVARLRTEEGWRSLADGAGKPLAILRLSGIYGPGRNALASMGDGTARRLVKPGQVFNRIHVEDIANAIAASFARKANGIYNITDDEPSPPQDVVAYAAALLNMEPPPEIPFDTAELTPMARSFYGENKRVQNLLMKKELGVRLIFPTYREGLAGLFVRGEGQGGKAPGSD